MAQIAELQTRQEKTEIQPAREKETGESHSETTAAETSGEDKTEESSTETVAAPSGTDGQTGETENSTKKTKKETTESTTEVTKKEATENTTEKTKEDAAKEAKKEIKEDTTEKTTELAKEAEVLREQTVTFTVPVSEDDLPDADELFAGYVEKTFYADWDTGTSTFGNLGADRLEGEYNQKLYAALKDKIKAVAAGNQTSTKFILAFNEAIGLTPLTWTAAELGVTEITKDTVDSKVGVKFAEKINTRNILDYLLVDCPYELYWFDKTVGLETSYSMSYNSSQVTISEINISFAVASEYQSAGNQYQVVTGVAAVGQAAAKAGEIVAKYQGKSDYEKLAGYRQEICALASYNTSAADDSKNTAYGNPWQLIWVFDGDASTEVVCEGYSKAFQYLCDMSTFTSAECYTVTGTMSGGTGAGPHMWNIVRLGGKNYLVDVTNCDTGSIGADDLLFLAGADGSVEGGYTVTCNETDVTYTYDSDQEAMYGSDILTLSNAKYVPGEALAVNFFAGGSAAGVGNGVTVKENPVYGDTWDEIVQIGNITAQAGDAVDGSPRYTLNVSGRPGAGGQTFQVLYSGTIGTKTYEDVPVCQGTVTVARRTVTVSAGTCKVAKVYDGTVSAGAISGDLSVAGILDGDSGVAVTAVPAVYESPDVGGQTTVEVALALQGDTEGNYQLASVTLAVPCEITPKTITPKVEIMGSYAYDSGKAVVPEVAVKDGERTLNESDYQVILSDNINAGTAKAEIRAKKGGNYTWSPQICTFMIEKVSYEKEKSASLSVRYGGSGVYDLAGILPEGAKLGALILADNDSILTGELGLDGTVLSYSAANSQANVGRTAKVTILVTESTNYLPFEVAITLNVTDKLSQTDFRFVSTEQNRVYGGEDFTVAAVGAAEGSEVTYASSDAETAAVDKAGKVHILKPGTVVITARAAETGDYHEGIASYTLTITPAVLAWDITDLSAADRIEKVDADSKAATLYGSLKVSGILERDAADVEFACLLEQLKGTYGKVEAGGQKVTLAWADDGNQAVLQGAKASYYILPSALPEITGLITEVTELPVVPPELQWDQYKLTSEEGISEVPEALAKGEMLNTPQKIMERMRSEILRVAQNSIATANTVVYDLTLMVKSEDGDGTWKVVTPEDFPKDGITVTLPYPAGTGKDTHVFTVVHMVTAGTEAGKTESLEVTNTADGIRFKVFSLSPVAVGWKEVKQDTPADTNRPGAGTDQDTGNKGSGSGNSGSGSGNSGSGSGNSGSGSGSSESGSGHSGSGTQNGNGDNSGNSGASGNQNGSNMGSQVNAGTDTNVVSGQKTISANTGDESPVMLYALLFLAAGGMLLGYASGRKRNLI